MKYSKICPSCRSKEISGPHKNHSNMVLILPSRTATLEGYSCFVCGFTQLFIDKIGLENLIKKGKIYNTENIDLYKNGDYRLSEKYTEY